MTGTNQKIDAWLTQPGSRDVRRDLIAIREKYGADSAVGIRCSNLIEQMMNLECGSPARQAALKRLMPLAIADLKRLLN